MNATGIVKTKVADREFGFISCEGQPSDVFFHADELVGVTYADLQQGAKVTFEIVKGPKGLSAKGVKLA